MTGSSADFVPCLIKQLPLDKQEEAARIAVDHNPANMPVVEQVGHITQALIMPFLSRKLTGDILPAVRQMLEDTKDDEDDPIVIASDRLAVVTSRYWDPGVVDLTVGFPFDTTPADVQNKILQYANLWNKNGANVHFRLTNTDPQIRIARTRGEGYYSYLGTDILSIPRNEPTMNLDSFTLSTPDSEYMRVVTHEFGHSMGFPHEHMRQELVSLLDEQKTIAYFQRSYGWPPNVTRQQVLTPLNARSIRGTPNADDTSIMCYQLPGSITKTGQPIRGGNEINVHDYNYVATLYPGIPSPPPPPPPPPSGTYRIVITTTTKPEIVVEPPATSVFSTSVFAVSKCA